MAHPDVVESPPAHAASRAGIARINGVALQRADEALDAEALRQRACTELLRQAAQACGLLAPNEPATVDGVATAATSQAIEALLERELVIPEPSLDACQRHYEAHVALYQTGEKVKARHILFAVTPGMDVVALRHRAEACLLDVRSYAPGAVDGFAEAARALSNCPSGAQGGALGWLSGGECAPEFARELFGHTEVGVLPRLVHSRFGLHVVEVQKREPGAQQAFAAVRGTVTMSLHQQAYVTALRQYLQVLAGQAVVQGVDLEGAQSPLVQ